MSYTTSELIWIQGLLEDLQVKVPTPIPLFCDNAAAKYIVENQIYQERTKHLRGWTVILLEIILIQLSLSSIKSNLVYNWLIL